MHWDGFRGHHFVLHDLIPQSTKGFFFSEAVDLTEVPQSAHIGKFCRPRTYPSGKRQNSSRQIEEGTKPAEGRNDTYDPVDVVEVKSPWWVQQGL